MPDPTVCKKTDFATLPHDAYDAAKVRGLKPLVGNVAEETRNPRRDMPIAILAALVGLVVMLIVRILRKKQLASGPVDLIASNLSFQWFRDLVGSVRGWTGRLPVGGQLVFNLLGSGSFQAWQDEFLRDPDTPRPPTFPHRDEMEKIYDARFCRMPDSSEETTARLTRPETNAGAG